MIKYIFTLIILLTSLPTYAIQTSRPLPGDSRLHVITYNPNSVHEYTGFYDYQASILFGEGEEVKTISMGNPSAWQMAPAGRRLFLTTNMLLITTKRTYHFLLRAAEVNEEGINDPNLTWETSFVYPDEDSGIIKTSAGGQGPDLSEPEKYNFNYSISGSEYIAPIRVFDDKEFTYFQFTKQNAEIPAFFLVDSEGKEALINYRVEGSYIVIERVASQFTLRHGSDVACIFNERSPLPKKPAPKKKPTLF
jgi:type IV secretion system protein VirB9